MPIVETKKYTRPNTNIDFFNVTNDPVLEQAKTAMGFEFTELERTPTYIKKASTDGKMIAERTISGTGLEQTMVVTFSDLATYSLVDTCLGIALDHAYKTYTEIEGFVPPTGNQYSQSGINQPFSCTTTYTYDGQTATKYPNFDAFIGVIEASDKLASLTNNGSVITAVHHYNNSADFTENHWNDYPFIDGLYAGGVTRTISYATL